MGVGPDITKPTFFFPLRLYLLITITKENDGGVGKGHRWSAEKTRAGVAGTEFVYCDSNRRHNEHHYTYCY